ncbi:MAG: hypothetical protein V7646_1541, partial [Pseudonocardia sp.]
MNEHGLIPRIASIFAAIALMLVPAAVSTTGCAGPPASPTMTPKTTPTPTPEPTTSPTPFTLPTPAPEPLDAPSDRRYPSEVLDLSNWYLTLPTGQERDPDDVYQPDLTTYV